MKYNPKACNAYAMLPEFLGRHPLGPEPQGFLACMYELQEMLQGNHRHAGGEPDAHGRRPGRVRRRRDDPRLSSCAQRSGAHRIIVPQAAHGTNPGDGGHVRLHA